jgi:hypothetical protein
LTTYVITKKFKALKDDLKLGTRRCLETCGG